MGEKEEAKRPTCFVIGPIGSPRSETRRDADFLLNGIIREALSSSAWERIWRADEDARPGIITDALIADLQVADLVIADLSELNPNVFYEIGIRHTLGKPIIHVASAGTRLPFDTNNQRTVFYDKQDWESIRAAREAIRQQADRCLRPDAKITNPVTQALNVIEVARSNDPQAEVLSRLSRRIGTIEQSLSNVSRQNAHTYNADGYAEFDRRKDWLERFLKESAGRVKIPEKVSTKFFEDFAGHTRFNSLRDMVEKGNLADAAAMVRPYDVDDDIPF